MLIRCRSTRAAAASSGTQQGRSRKPLIASESVLVASKAPTSRSSRAALSGVAAARKSAPRGLIKPAKNTTAKAHDASSPTPADTAPLSISVEHKSGRSTPTLIISDAPDQTLGIASKSQPRPRSGVRAESPVLQCGASSVECLPALSDDLPMHPIAAASSGSLQHLSHVGASHNQPRSSSASPAPAHAPVPPQGVRSAPTSPLAARRAEALALHEDPRLDARRRPLVSRDQAETLACRADPDCPVPPSASPAAAPVLEASTQSSLDDSSALPRPITPCPPPSSPSVLSADPTPQNAPSAQSPLPVPAVTVTVTAPLCTDPPSPVAACPDLFAESSLDSPDAAVPSLSSASLLGPASNRSPTPSHISLCPPVVPPRTASTTLPRARHSIIGHSSLATLDLVTSTLGVEPERVVFTGTQLGAGCFGLVLEAWLLPPGHTAESSNDGTVSTVHSPTLTASARTLVAVKLLRDDAPEAERECLQAEARVMSLLTAHPHPHIVTLLGLTTTVRGLALVEEHCGLGSLLDFLRGGRTASAHTAMFSMSVRLSFAAQMADALAFIARLGIVHRDVAARNVLITNQMLCKLCDFGFSRAMLEDGVYQKTSSGRVPYKWMALESLAVGLYSEKSDVWAFGVALWEIVTMGEKPFACVENCDVLAHLQQGKRLQRPVGCTPALYAIMSDCWLPDPTTRPCFTTIAASLQAIRTHLVRPLRRQHVSLSAKISKMFSKLLRRSPSAPLDHQTRAALLAMVSRQRLTIEECQMILLDFQRGLLAGPPCAEGEVHALALLDRHRHLRAPRITDSSTRSDLSAISGQDLTEENIALHRSVSSVRRASASARVSALTDC